MTVMQTFQVQPVSAADRAWRSALLEKEWGATWVVSRGRLHRADELPGFIGVRGAEHIGLVTYRIEAGECEIVSLNSLVESIGVGSQLIAAVKDVAVAARCKRLWLITTNDNTHALRFYQRRGFTIAAVHVNAIAESRKLKPMISLFGIDGIPIRDEIELEIIL